MKISIIIPVYNSEKYLDECLKSLKDQTYRNLEIILVDDGSTDNSLKICASYAKDDKRFKVYHKENGGTASARNYGLQKASGDYITFIDNDDYINDKDAFANISKILKDEDIDVLLHSCIYYWDDTKKFDYPNINIRSGKYTSKEILIGNGLYTYTVWDKIFKSSLLKDNNIKFADGKRNEDSDFNIKIFPFAKKFYYLKNPFYVYRKATSYSQTSILKYSHISDLKDIIENNVDGDLNMKSYIAYLYAVYIAQATLLNTKKAKDDLKYMRKYANLLNYNLNPSMKKVTLVYKIFGFNITRYLLSIYISRKYKLKKEN